MKKFLLTAALILALVTSLTAGTMAYYSAEVGVIKSNVSSKYFTFTADKTSASFSEGIKIAPGDDVTYKITVNNASEVRTDATVIASLSNVFTGLTVKVEHVGDNANTDKVNGAAAGTSTATTLMGTASTQEYLVTVDWDYATGKTSDDSKNQTTTLTININGQQHNENATITANK